MERGTPGIRGGQRKAGTTRPAARVAADNRRAAPANQEIDAEIDAEIDTELGTELGTESEMLLGASPLMVALSHGGVTQTPLERTERQRSLKSVNQRRLLPSRRSPHDSEIRRLALPALGALAAEPLYVLVDTAIVGRLGIEPLAGLAVAGIVLTAMYGICNFLAYSTTALVARRVGANDPRGAAELGVDGAAVALSLGIALMVIGLLGAPLIVDAMGASSSAAPYALEYLRISLFGAPAMLFMLAGSGYLRGRQDTRTTLVIAVAANIINLALELIFVYGLDAGIAGSAWGTVVAQWAAAIAFAVIMVRSVRATGARHRPRLSGMRHTAVVGGPLIVRTLALIFVFLATTNLTARISDSAVAAYQIAFQIFILLALTVDALAIASQALIGKFLGANDPDSARASARRMLEWGVLVGLILAVVLTVFRYDLVAIFTNDSATRELAAQMILVVAVLQPLNAVVFVLDGVLIGAGDQRFLAVAMVIATIGVWIPAVLIITELGGGPVALWGALALFFVARAVGLGIRFRSHAWEVSGANRR